MARNSFSVILRIMFHTFFVGVLELIVETYFFYDSRFFFLNVRLALALATLAFMALAKQG